MDSRAPCCDLYWRNTPIPVDSPYGLTRAFADGAGKQQQPLAENMEAELPSLTEI
jgi:hypothetical protein